MAALAGWIVLILFFAIAIVKPALFPANAAVFIGASVSLMAGVAILDMLNVYSSLNTP